MSDCSTCDYAGSTMGGRCCREDDSSNHPYCSSGSCDNPVTTWGNLCVKCANKAVNAPKPKTFTEAEVHELVLKTVAKKDAELEKCKRELLAALDSTNSWRRLALQFDGQRMQAMSMLKDIAKGWQDVKAVREFIAAAPVSGDKHLAEIKADAVMRFGAQNFIDYKLVTEYAERIRQGGAE